MSRLIIKNLPKGIKEDRLKKLFSEHGNVTDCALKFTKDGVFRKFAFIGYQNKEEADRARKYFDKTFIDTSRIQVEFAKSFGDADKPRAWSKYSKESSAYKAKEIASTPAKDQVQKESKSERKKRAKEERLKDMLGELKDDPGFEEFLSVHQNVATKTTWSNDTMATQQDKGQTTLPDTELDSGNSSAESDVEIETPKKIKEKGKQPQKVDSEAKKSGLSDLEYLKSKMGGNELEDSSSSSSDEEEEITQQGKVSKSETDSSSSESESVEAVHAKGDNSSQILAPKKLLSPKSRKSDKAKELEIASSKKDAVVEQKFSVKVRGFQGNVGEKAITEFFNPLTVKGIRIPRNAKRKPIGIAYVDFNSEKDLDQALRKNKNFIGGKRVFLKKVASDTVEDTQLKPRPWELKNQSGEEEEGIGESGRLYVRNLAYVCTEDDLQQLFSKYGPLTEVNLPVDKITKKIKGFAHITFMMPEHAVKAYTEQDGKVFLGRMLHILPGKPKKEEQYEVTEQSSYKKQKAAKEKAAAGSSHNWNSLFLGVNAVADVMANKYNTAKSQILDAGASQSLGVRMALGETQVVSETRDFLTDNGVQLDSFSQPSAPRSKTVILVKNLPAGTKPDELRAVFSLHGGVGRVVLPPSGITAVIEFLEPSEARAAFTKLAYTKFKHVPLYLEWAPMEVFKPKPTTADEDQKTETKMDVDKPPETKQKTEDEDSDDESETPGTVLFVKNLNFDTREDALRKLFEKCGPIKRVTVALKKDMKNPGQMLSMGYGFVQYASVSSAQQALKGLQHTELDGHQLDLKVSNRTTLQPETSGKKKQAETKQKSSKILVRNVPFEAKAHEVLELFKVFGELKSVRLPKKLGGTGRHRGFGFVDFLTKQDAKRAFQALCHSTHLYGRRLVLEWADAEENIDDLRKKTAEHFHDESPRKRLKKSDLMEALGE